MIQIDMPMPEKCSDCIFCNDNCSCVASDYNELGINVGCAYRTGRRDIRCPLKEQEKATVISIHRNGFGSRVGACPNCQRVLHYERNQSFCGKCGQAVKWE